MPFKKTKKAEKSLVVRVTTMDADLEFALDWRATGKDLFDQVCRTIGLRETWYFGLQYVVSGMVAWLKMDKRVLSQDVGRSAMPIQFSFLAQYFPEDVSEELVQELTQHLFFLQVKQSILNMDIYCPPEASVLLASYAVQAKYGDFDEASYKPGFLASEDLLPQRVIDQYQMTPQMWEDRIKVWYADHKGMTRDEAELEYLKIAQDLDMYGVNYFPIKMLELCIGNHDRFMRRRKPDPMEVQQMKAQAKEEKLRRQMERSKLAREKQLRQDLERQKAELEQRLVHYQEEARLAQQQLRRSEEAAELLAEKSRIAEEEARLLTHKARQAESEVERVRKEAAKSEDERLMLERKAREAEELASQCLNESDRRASEARKLSEELLKARLSEKMAKERLAQVLQSSVSGISLLSQSSALGSSGVVGCESVSDSSGMLLLGSGRIPSSELNACEEEFSSSGLDLHDTSGLGVDMMLYENAPETDVLDYDLLVTDSDMEKLTLAIEKERVDYLLKSQTLQDQLRELKSEIDLLKVEDQQTSLDLYHEEQLAKGENKYSTLRKIRSGSTKARVAFFQEL
ncbi:unnamed protein product [Notodromas monacha]|uniref:Moesin/ezrin/radixin homolog 1 n=1 Tax=Notodromas monacha TaxID=399045 RepID=A0A7R9BGS0_9CRUS|nr:unnamed protein product [Notodromas monacha]CAG0915019.1 unnamed protein product [Notodromas monacha]